MDMPGKHETLTHCRFYVEPAWQTLAQHKTGSESMSLGSRETNMTWCMAQCFPLWLVFDSALYQCRLIAGYWRAGPITRALNDTLKLSGHYSQMTYICIHQRTWASFSTHWVTRTGYQSMPTPLEAMQVEEKSCHKNDMQNIDNVESKFMQHKKNTSRSQPLLKSRLCMVLQFASSASTVTPSYNVSLTLYSLHSHVFIKTSNPLTAGATYIRVFIFY